MDNWRKIYLSELGKIIGGGTPSTTISEYWDGNIPWITPKDLSNYHKKGIKNGERLITKLGLSNSSAKLLPKGTVLFSSRAPIGYVAIAESELCTNQGFKNIIVNENFDNHYVYYLLLHNKEIIENFANGSTFKEISTSGMSYIEVLVTTSLAEQKRIAEILSSLDDTIELNNKMNKTLEETAQAIFKQWFVDFEFPDENGNPYKSSGGKMIQSELGDIPDGWVAKKLGTILELVVDNRGKTVPTSKEGIPLIATNCIKNENIYPIYEKIRFVSDETYNKWFRAHPKTGDIIFVNKGTPGCINLVPEPIDFCIAQDMIALRVDNKIINSYYLFLYFRSVEAQTIIKNSSVGTSIPHLKKTDLLKFVICVPNILILNKFNIAVSEMFRQMNINNNENRTIIKIRGNLLPKLMSGEIRI